MACQIMGDPASHRIGLRPTGSTPTETQRLADLRIGRTAEPLNMKNVAQASHSQRAESQVNGPSESGWQSPPVSVRWNRAKPRPDGEIGRRTGLKIPWGEIPVRVRSPLRPFTAQGLTTNGRESFFCARNEKGTNRARHWLCMGLASIFSSTVTT